MAARSYLTAPIAIIGIAGQLGGCPDLGALWQLLDSGRDAFTDGPPDRTGLANWPAHIPSRGAYLPDVAGFDAGFFGISPREAEVIDPQQRLLLETTWRALEDSGTPAESLADRAVGVYTGALWNDYESLRRTTGMPVTQHSAVGNSLDVLSARLSYFLRLHGPSLTVQSSCSSSLVALHLACAALASGEIEEALVGASNLILDPQTSEGLDLFGGLSPTGLCRPFAAGADGFVRGEGVLAVHLKPLAVALADGNDVHALIVASGVNNDGGGDSLATPNGAAQEALLREVYGLLGPDRERLVYVEAHGTGTRKGDPTEAGAIGRALGRPGRGLAIGSVKSSVGHLEPAAGLAGLLKTVLSLRHGRVPATVNCESPNPEIPFAELGLDVVRSPLELPSDPAPLLGVNSFGWGGTNAHVVLGPPLPGTARRPVGPAARRAGERAVDPAVGPATAEGPVTVRLSASSAAALEPVAQGWADRLDGCPEDEVRALAAAQAWQRSALPERCAVVLPSAAGDLAATAVRLCPAAAGQQDTPAGEETLLPSGARVRRGRAVSRGEVAFVFPGQGAQWAGMAAGLYAEWDVFRASFDRCAEALTPHLSTDVRELATRPDETDWLRRVELVQPALWAMMVSLADVWRACGVTPSIVVGHSQGEIAAACVAGALSLEDGATVVARRSALLHSLAGRGRMLAVHLPREDVLAALVDFAGQVDLAVHNGPTSCVVSGDPDAVLLLREILEADGVFCRLVDVDYASHGPQVEELAGEIESALRSISPRPATIPMLSTVDLEQVDGTALGPSYWVRNLRQPVRFAEAMAHLTARGLTHVVEVSPHPGLSAAIADTTREAGHEAVVIPTLRRDAGSVMDLTSQLAQAWVTGLPARGARPAGPHRATPPAYPFQRRRYWADPALEAPPATVEPPRRDAAQALGHTTSTLRVGPERQPWLRDHQLGSDAVLPAAFSLAAAALAGPARALRSVRLPEPLVLTPGDRSLAVDLHRGEGTRLTVWSRHDDVAGAGHAGDGRLTHLIAEVLDAEGCAAADGRPTGAQGRAGGLSVRGPAAVDLPVEGFYASCARRGVTYGPAFRVVQRIERGEGWVSARLRLPSRTPDFPGVIHPILLDGIMQPVLAIDDEDPRVLPARLEQLRFHGSGVAGSKEPSEETTLRELTVEAVRDDSGTFTVCGRTLDGEPVVSIHGLQLVPLRSDADTAIPRLEFALADATGEPDPAAGPSSDGTGDT
ncbi:MAG TPA: acyltransferase domain-containing protein, partial [Kineosporiaceae bacterium]